MGYYTTHELELQADKDFELTDPTAIIAKFRETCDPASAIDLNGKSDGETKWYDCETDLAAFSKLYPMILFVMSVQGEDGKQWQIFAKNGKSYQNDAIVTFPPFDPDKLR